MLSSPINGVRARSRASLLRQFEVYRAENIEEFLDIAQSCVIGTRPANERTVSVKVSGEVEVPMANYANWRGFADVTNADAFGSVDNNFSLVRPDGVLVTPPTQ